MQEHSSLVFALKKALHVTVLKNALHIALFIMILVQITKAHVD